ncbi:MAG: hypothetical protein LBE80_02235, partial [Deltaproteobacteria bacterium]|nr:hypothetical protein [Deltaproteobacteria bacterium]
MRDDSVKRPVSKNGKDHTVERPVSKNEKGHRPFFLQEIREQPNSLAYTLAQFLGPNFQLRMNKFPLDDQSLKKIK